MINFCHGSLKPVITCDNVCADDYGVENLISGVDYWASRRGFRAERFIIPPVSVTVRFPCNIQIARIVIDPVVGRQKSSGFEIFACTRRQHISWLCEPNIDKNRPNSEGEEIFGPVGKESLQEPCIVHFENSAYRPRRPFDVFGDECSRGGKSSLLRRHRTASLSSVSAVTVRIVQTVERGAPALKLLEIWGQPALSCPPQLQMTIFQLYSKARAGPNSNGLHLGDPHSTGVSEYPITPSVVQSKPVVTVNNSSNTYPASGDGPVDIPEDFIDPITCDIMTVPLTLPSGKTIDQLTLDKHIHAESKWGRPPSDPFTGVPFCDLKKPIPNVSLKLRIDQFVLNHSSELKTIPRVLGRGQSAHWIQHSTVNVCEHPPSCTTNCPSDSLSTSANVKRKYNKGSDSVVTFGTKYVKLEVSDTNKKFAFEKTNNHETKLSQSLDTALYAALGGLPSFQTGGGNSTKDNTLSQGDFSSLYTCAYCNKSNVSHTLYTLACGHYSCRACLSRTLGSGSSGACQACGKRFFSKDVTKLNV